MGGGVKGLRIGVVKEGFGHPAIHAGGRRRPGAGSAPTGCEGSAPSSRRSRSRCIALGAAIWLPVAAEGATVQMMLGNGFGFNWQGLYVNSPARCAQRPGASRADELSETLKNTMLLGPLHGHPASRALLRQGAEPGPPAARGLRRRAGAIRPAGDADPADGGDQAAGPGAPTAEIIQRAFEMLPNTAPFDCTHHPAMSLPCGLVDGLPVGLMLIGKLYDEGTIYRAAAAFEQASTGRRSRRAEAGRGRRGSRRAGSPPICRASEACSRARGSLPGIPPSGDPGPRKREHELATRRGSRRPAAPPKDVELVIIPRAHDVGGFEVRRALPAQERMLVGPFIFFDQMGPGEFLAGRGLDVRPHPHIGLSTVTYLFEGAIQHRDSLGSDQPILPGDVNWMTAGRGITHSERTSAEDRAPRATTCPASSPGWRCPNPPRRPRRPSPTTRRATLPVVEEGGVQLRLIAGRGLGAAGRRSRPPRRCSTPTRCWPRAPGCRCRTGTRSAPPMCCEGAVAVAGDGFEPGRMLVFRAGDAAGADRRAGGRAAAAAGRGGDGRAALRLLELRQLLPRADRAGQGGLAGPALRQGARPTTRSSSRCRRRCGCGPGRPARADARERGGRRAVPWTLPDMHVFPFCTQMFRLAAGTDPQFSSSDVKNFHEYCEYFSLFIPQRNLPGWPRHQRM